jgi:drug/metabolite transporter (DMT)-like permease
MSPHLGELAALGTACCWTVTALSFESAGRRVGSLPVNLVRLLLAAGFLMVFGWLTRGRPLPTDASLQAWIWLSISGWIGFCIGDLCLFRAFLIVGSRIAMLLMALVPPITAVVGRFFLGEQLSGQDWIGMALTVAGVAWVVLERPQTRVQQTRLPPSATRQAAETAPRWQGILLGIGGATGQAVGLVFSKHGMGGYDAFAATQIRVIAGAVGFALLFTWIGWWPRVLSALTHRAAMARISLGAFCGPFLGVSLSLVAVQHTTTGVATTIMSIVPVLIIVPTVLIYRVGVSLRAVAGAILAVGGVALLFL